MCQRWLPPAQFSPNALHALYGHYTCSQELCKRQHTHVRTPPTLSQHKLTSPPSAEWLGRLVALTGWERTAAVFNVWQGLVNAFRQVWHTQAVSTHVNKGYTLIFTFAPTSWLDTGLDSKALCETHCHVKSLCSTQAASFSPGSWGCLPLTTQAGQERSDWPEVIDQESVGGGV